MRVFVYLLIGILLVIILLFSLSFIYEKTTLEQNSVQLGVSFSPRYARYLKLDWQKTYLQILDELKVKKLRITTYWNSLEPKEGEYNFSDTDFMLDEAAKRKALVILVLGARQPRWPECHYPAWAKKLTVSKRQQKTLEFIQKVVERYKQYPSIFAYQVENEPFVTWFGEDCDLLDKEFLQKEIKLVKQIDSKKPIIVTDSGEWGSWVGSINSADILGVSIYRTSYNPTLGLHVNYPFLPSMYTLKANLVKKLTQNKKIIVSELQTEPWLSDSDTKENSPIKQSHLFSLKDFKDNVSFVQKTNFDQAYLWGVEWWYFMDQNGYPEYLEFAKTLFK